MKFENRIICGDATKILSELPNSSVDLVITSPPYNLGIKYDVYEDNLPWDEYYSWCAEWLNQIYRVLKEDGRVCLVHYLSCGNKDFKETPLMKLRYLSDEIGFKYWGLIIWLDTTLSTLTAWGSWLSASCPYIQSPFEGVLLLYKKSWKKLTTGETIISKEEFIEGVSGVWRIPPDKTKEHPATFPLEFALRCIRLFSYESDLVVDPFCGQGTVGVAAKMLGRKYLLIDISKEYCRLASKFLSFGLLI